MSLFLISVQIILNVEFGFFSVASCVRSTMPRSMPKGCFRHAATIDSPSHWLRIVCVVAQLARLEYFLPLVRPVQRQSGLRHPRNDLQGAEHHGRSTSPWPSRFTPRLDSPPHRVLMVSLIVPWPRLGGPILQENSDHSQFDFWLLFSGLLCE